MNDTSNIFIVDKELRSLRVSLTEFAEILGIPVRTVYQWKATGQIPKARVGVVSYVLQSLRNEKRSTLSRDEMDYEENWLARLHTKRMELLRELEEVEAMLKEHGE
jgi:predicted site-specific integrase-resolvase